MTQTLINIDDNTESVLLNISRIENRKVDNILQDAILDYTKRYSETLELISNKEHFKAIKTGKNEIKNKIKGVSLNELDS